MLVELWSPLLPHSPYRARHESSSLKLGRTRSAMGKER